MRHAWTYKNKIAAIFFAMAFSLISLSVVYALNTEYCNDDTAIPPFISPGVDPNLLLVIDNSASMLDPAYVDGNDYCLDDTYSSADSYAGYFDSAEMYVYDMTNDIFKPLIGNEALYDSAAAVDTYAYPTAVATDVLHVKMTGTSGVDRVVTAFKASGNLLNWAVSSKIDLQKKILTGGKYEAAGGYHDPSGTDAHMIMESRGCLERRMIKKVEVKDSNGTGADNFVTLAVVPPKEATLLDRNPDYKGNWAETTAYSVGNIVNDAGELYQCAVAGTSGTLSTDNDNEQYGLGNPTPKWAVYTQTRWTANTAYAAGSIVSDPQKINTVDEGQLYITPGGGTTCVASATCTGVDDDTGITDWEPYNESQIEIFEVTTTGFDNTACEDAAYLLSIGGSQGTIKQDIQDCMDYQIAGGNEGDYSNYNAGFNHSIHNCWYAVKHDDDLKTGGWPPGAGPVQAIMPACEAMYEGTPPLAPWEITPDNPAYVCYGVYDTDPLTAGPQSAGYVGRCWEPATASAPVCTKCPDKSVAPADCDPEDCTKWEDPADVGTDRWVVGAETVDNFPVKEPAGDGTIDYQDCINQALMDFCGLMEIPDVVDPSDQIAGTTEITGDTGELWNMPAMLTDSGVVAQLGGPLLTMRGLIKQDTTPSGIIQKYADDIRIGAMVFNNEGSDSECDTTDTYILYDCDNASNKDGGKVISYIDIDPATWAAGITYAVDDTVKYGGIIYKASAVTGDPSDGANPSGDTKATWTNMGATHSSGLVEALNDIKATSWTPIAEAIYNAIGYYTQRSDMRLDDGSVVSADFILETEGGEDPITAYCQDNNILIITEGASTADVSSTITDFVAAGNNDDAAGTDGIADTEADTADDATISPCGVLNGSTVLDDLTYFAKYSATCHTSQIDGEDKQNIATHIVVAGTLRDTGAADECNPSWLLEQAAANGGTALYDASNPDDLEDSLEDAFAAIRAGAAAGSAASVISASRSGEGAAYQAIFWPSVEVSTDVSVDWVGEVHSLLVDSLGNLYEDTNGNHALDADSGDDKRVIFFFNEDDSHTYACVGGTLDASNSCVGGTVRHLSEVKYHWSAAQWLSEVAPHATDSNNDILTNRTLVGTTAGYVSETKKRYIFTWSDLNNDGVVDSGETIDFTPGAVNWTTASVSGGRGPVAFDFGIYPDTTDAATITATNTEVDKIIKWVRGLDDTADNLRLRQMNYDFGDGESQITWRLGDVIHSTPISVAAPSEGYHFLYRDDSYAQFVAHYKKRRHMIYFGANDGMMHAVNGGFFKETESRFCRTVDCAGSDAGTPELGAEMWAYVPYNLLPHLRCMTSENYNHKYYVDQRPRLFDVKLWPDDPDDGVHIGGWGTILVGAMRYGGGRVDMSDLDLDQDGNADFSADTREFTSAYFIMDITNPEAPPTLLAEMTRPVGSEAEMGFTLAIPTLVVMRHGSPEPPATPLTFTYKWYLVMGSGPTNVNGTSNQVAKVAVFPLDRLVDSPDDFSIPDNEPTDPDEFGRFVLDSTDNPNSFISDLISVDFELDELYKADVVYFGTVSGSGAPYGGSMHRLVTREIDNGTGYQVETKPSDWAGLLNRAPFTVGHASISDNPQPLIYTNQPVTASASAGYDGKNYWIYFGTGRFLDNDDKADAYQQTYYGIKEPLSYSGTITDCNSSFTWQTVEKTGLTEDTHNSTPGEQKLLRVDQILVEPAAAATSANLYCRDGTGACLVADADTTLSTFNTLETYIAGTGTGCETALTVDHGTDGWYKNFLETKERNVGQATLLGGLLTYTTYQPTIDSCLSEGLGNLYGVYYRTGTAFYVPIFLTDDSTGLDADNRVIDKVSLGRGLATTPNLHVGKQEGAKAFVQTSTGTIVEVPQPNLPLSNAKTGKTSWGEVNLLP